MLPQKTQPWSVSGSGSPPSTGNCISSDSRLVSWGAPSPSVHRTSTDSTGPPERVMIQGETPASYSSSVGGGSLAPKRVGEPGVSPIASRQAPITEGMARTRMAAS